MTVLRSPLAPDLIQRTLMTILTMLFVTLSVGMSIHVLGVKLDSDPQL